MTNEAEMLAELEELFRPQYPAHAQTAAQLAETLGVNVYVMAHKLSKLVDEGKWARAQTGKCFVYWKLD